MSISRSSTMRWSRAGFCLAAAVFCCASPANAYDTAAVGYNQLLAELGIATPNGAGVTVSQIEAPFGPAYAPNTSLFPGKSFTLMSPGSGVSGHATTVAGNFYGSGIGAGITSVHLWDANHFLQEGLLDVANTGVAPLNETAKVENHSYMGSFGSTALDSDALRRLDYMVNTDDVIVVVAQNNGVSTTIPALLDTAYNTISVGLTNGVHSAGFTTFDVAGRIKPDIVAPESATSYATPIVAAAAAQMVQVANSHSWTNGAHNQTVKAVLLAGATKSEFASWSRTSTRPLDLRYGAGELNVYRSYHILAAGEHEAGTIATVPNIGWDFSTTTAGTKKYFFDLTTPVRELTASLIWNRLVDDPSVVGFDTAAFVANLDLKLSTASGFTVGTMIDQSVSTVDNVELIYLTNLLPGRYVWEVSSPTTGMNYALAWYTEVPEPGGLTALIGLVLVLRRRSRLASV